MKDRPPTSRLNRRAVNCWLTRVGHEKLHENENKSRLRSEMLIKKVQIPHALILPGDAVSSCFRIKITGVWLIAQCVDGIMCSSGLNGCKLCRSLSPFQLVKSLSSFQSTASLNENSLNEEKVALSLINFITNDRRCSIRRRMLEFCAFER